jgi:hypothetical protein
MRHPRVIIAGLGLAAVAAAGPGPAPPAGGGPAIDTARHPGGRADDHRRHQPH